MSSIPVCRTGVFSLVPASLLEEAVSEAAEPVKRKAVLTENGRRGSQLLPCYMTDTDLDMNIEPHLDPVKVALKYLSSVRANGQLLPGGLANLLVRSCGFPIGTTHFRRRPVTSRKLQSICFPQQNRTARVPQPPSQNFSLSSLVQQED
jgi:hypothetical protein